MPPPARIIRGVKDIRTRSGTPDNTLVPYKAYMVITALEMEQFRREKERNNLKIRLLSIDRRLDAIKVEKTNLLRRLGNAPRRKVVGKIPASPVHATGQAVGSFKFQY
jgi:hypothetical protein